MRFSDTPLWWRLLVIAATLAIGWAVYAIAAWAVTKMSDGWVIGAFFVVMALAIGAIIYDRLRRRSADRLRDQIPQRRNSSLE